MPTQVHHYILVRERGECMTPDEILTNARISVQQCAEMCREKAGCIYFVHTDDGLCLWEKLVEPSVAIFSTTVMIDHRAVQFFYEISEMGRLSETAAYIEDFFPMQIRIGE